MANLPWFCTIHTPAMSQLPLCGSASTAPRPFFSIAAHTVSMFSTSSRLPSSA